MKLHLGCGRRRIPGWAHVDAVPFEHVDIVHAVDSLPMIADNSVELAYACHVLEHFTRAEVPRVLAEWHRILQPWGVLRLSVPDFAALVRIYQWHRRLADVIGPLFGRGDYLYNVHHTVFDEPTLSALLHRAGFDDVRVWDWRTTEHASIDDYSQAYLPPFDREHGIAVSLNLEATKAP